jgi:serine/threonine-protein kinase
VPRGLEALINRCLEKEPARRFADVAELANELSPFASDEGRASSERISRISLKPGFPKASAKRALPPVIEPTLLAIEPKPRGRRNSAALVLSLAFGFGALGVVIWFGLRAPSQSVAVAPALPSNIAVSASAAVIAAIPIVTPVPGSVASSAPLADVTEVAPSSTVPLALSARNAGWARPPKLHVVVHPEAVTAELAGKLAGPAAAPAAAPANPPSTNPLDERK